MELPERSGTAGTVPVRCLFDSTTSARTGSVCTKLNCDESNSVTKPPAIVRVVLYVVALYALVALALWIGKLF